LTLLSGGIDLAGIFPLYIDIRRGAIITFVTAWVCQPWQLVNKSTTFLSVISSFSVFLAPLMGIMVADFYLVRRMKVKLSDLYKLHGSFYFWHGINWRAFPAWIVGWGPTVGGLAFTANPNKKGPRVLYELYYVAFFYGPYKRAISLYTIFLTVLT
jgi:nucleobase:cation symporter-1, NCS1 family